MPRFSFFHLFCFCLLFSFSFQIPSDEEQAEKIRDILKNPKRWDFSNNELSNDKFCYLTKDNNGKYTCNWGTYAESLGRIALIGGVISVTLLVLLYLVWCLRCCGLCGGTGPAESSDGEMGLRVGLIILAVLMLFLSILIFYGNEKFFVGADDSASLALKEADNALATAQNITASINSLQTISVPPSTNATANKIVADLKHYTSDAHDVYDRFTLNSPGRKAICGVVYSICLIIILLGLIGAILINSRITCAFNILGIILLLILWIWMAFVFTAGTADSDLCFDSNYALQGPLNPTQIYLVTFYNCSNSDFKTLINDLTRQKNENLLKFCTLVYPTFCNYPNPNYKVYCNQSAECLKFNTSSDVTSIVIQEGNKNLTVSQCATQCQDPIIKNISLNVVLYGKDFDTVTYILAVCNKYVDCKWMQDIIRTVFPSACVDSIRGVGYTLGGSFFVSVLLLIAIILSYFAINKFAAKSGDGGHEMSHLSK